MAATLRDVLNAFDNHTGACSVTQMARELEMPRDRLESMLEFWVRKGELREVRLGSDCGSCGIKSECPFVVQMPRSYERIRKGETPPAADCSTCCTA